MKSYYVSRHFLNSRFLAKEKRDFDKEKGIVEKVGSFAANFGCWVLH